MIKNYLNTSFGGAFILALFLFVVSGFLSTAQAAILFQSKAGLLSESCGQNVPSSEWLPWSQETQLIIGCTTPIPGRTKYFTHTTSDNQHDVYNEHHFSSTPIIMPGTTYYLGLFHRIDRINGRDVYHDGDGAPYSTDKLFELYNPPTIRWVISTGYNQWLECRNGSCDHKYTASFWIDPGQCSGCVTQLDYGWPNVAPYGYYPGCNCENNLTGFYAMDYERWHAIVLGVTPSSGGAATDGRVRLWINGTLTTDIPNVKTQDASVLPAGRLDFLTTMGQDQYDTPAHIRSVDNFILADSLADIQALGLMADPEFGNPSPTPDTQAPTPPGSLSASVISPTQINLSWSASTDNVGVTGYRLERCTGAGCTNFIQIAAPTGTSFQNTTVIAGTTYQYRMRAMDATGNLSEYSSIVSATTPKSTPVPLSGGILLAAYSFDESSGTAAFDTSGNFYTGTLVNSPARVPGKYGNALSFDGIDDRVDAPNIMASRVTAFTLEAWIYKTAVKDARIIYKNNAGNVSSPVAGLASGSDNKVRCRMRVSDGTGVDISAGSISLNTWTFAACVYDGSNVIVYQDGVEAGRTPKTGTLALTNDMLVIGQNEAGTGADRHWPGIIDEVRIYSRALSQSEIQSDMNTPLGGGSTDTTPPAVPQGVRVF